MMRSLFSGVSGLRAHQSKMDVIGNNIANVNTVGFKSSSVNFADVFYQTSQHASGPNNETGTAGRNALQTGLGSKVSSITTTIGQAGGAQRTDNPFDVMIEGDAFFVVNSGGTNYFTKAGDFTVDGFGNLTTSAGAFVMGWQPDPNNPDRTITTEVSPLRIMSPENLFTAPEGTSKTHVTGNIDSKDTQLTDTGTIMNVPFYDNLGHAYRAQVRLNQVSDKTNHYTLSIEDIKGEDGMSIFVTENNDPTVDGKYKLRTPLPTVEFGGQTIGETNITLDPIDGSVEIAFAGTQPIIKFDAGTGEFTGIGDANEDSLNFVITDVGGADSGNPFRPIDIDFSALTMYAGSGTTTLEAHRGGSDGLGGGKKMGEMSGIGIDGSGKIYGRYDNGDTKLLGQIATATFANAAGLEAVGGNMFAETRNSGSFDGIGQDATHGGGGLSTGMLEMSNVDLSSEFTQMITTQRGFQANSRIITTSDTMLEELLSLKR